MTSSRSNIVCALVIALALHALLAGALALYLNYAPAPDELAKLDLTSVDLSFAETAEETAAIVASAPSTPSEPVKAVPPTPPVDAGPCPRPPVDAGPCPRLPVDAGPCPRLPVDAGPCPRPPVDAGPCPRQTEAKLPSPAEPIEKVKIEPRREVERQETRDEKPQETRDEKPKPTEAARTSPQQAAPPQQASAPRQARVDAPPKPRRAIRPDYPRESRLRGEHGDVALELDVAADGSVSAVRILKSPGFPLLDEAAVKAARAARFTPAKSGGKSVASTVRLTLDFRLK